MSQSEIAKRELQAVQDAVKLQEVKEKYEIQRREADREIAEKAAAETKKLANRENFREIVRDSRDLENELQQLVEYLQDITQATAVYIGKVVHP